MSPVFRTRPLNLLQKSAKFVWSSDLVVDGFFGRSWLDLVLMAAVGFIFWALWRDYCLPPQPKETVVAKAGIAPFHVIQATDLSLSDKDRDVPADKAAPFLGHYAFGYLSAGKSLDPNQLSQGAALTSAEMANRSVVRLTVQSTPLFAGMKPPFVAALMGAPADRGTTALLEHDVIVLDLQPAGDSMAAVVAVPSTGLPALAGFLGHTGLILVAENR
jgi:hypothetical protein